MRKAPPGLKPDAVLRVEPGRPDRSALVERVASRYPALQMPPLGTALADDDAVDLLRRWIAEMDAARKDPTEEQKGHSQ